MFSPTGRIGLTRDVSLTETGQQVTQMLPSVIVYVKFLSGKYRNDFSHFVKKHKLRHWCCDEGYFDQSVRVFEVVGEPHLLDQLVNRNCIRSWEFPISVRVPFIATGTGAEKEYKASKIRETSIPTILETGLEKGIPTDQVNGKNKKKKPSGKPLVSSEIQEVLKSASTLDAQTVCPNKKRNASAVPKNWEGAGSAIQPFNFLVWLELNAPETAQWVKVLSSAY